MLLNRRCDPMKGRISYPIKAVFAVFYFCHFIVKLRNQFIANRGSIIQIGIKALHHQSGTIHLRLRHSEFNPRRAQNDGVDRACNFNPMPCHSLVNP